MSSDVSPSHSDQIPSEEVPSPSPSSDHATEQSMLRDVIIIGAGPCGLAVAARLCEHTPSAIFTDEEHRRYHWIRKHGRRMSILRGRRGCPVLADPDARHSSNEAASDADNDVARSGGISNGSSSRRLDHYNGITHARTYDTLVLDATADQWLANWNRLFKQFAITHLRSPMFFHVDPRDRDGLLAYAHQEQRKDELREIKACVGKELSKHRRKKRAGRMCKELGNGPKAKIEVDERDRKDYFVPSRSLFENHCECIADRYGLNEGLVWKEAVRDIDFGHVAFISEKEKVFTLKTDRGVHYARAVVMAVGAGNAPTLPPLQDTVGLEGMCHSNQIGEFPSNGVQRKIEQHKQTNIVVIGGGLTSAQVADLAVRKGVTKVWHLMRSELKVKPFDVDLAWMGKFKNREKAMFWSADSDKERLDHIRSARNGGSITPPYAILLKHHQDSGALSLHTHTTLSTTDCTFDGTTKTWSISTIPPIQGLPAIDYIYFATGIASDFSTLPFLSTMLKKYPLHGHGGFPCLSEDLMWRGAVQGVALGRKEDRSKVDGRGSGRKRELPGDKSGDDEFIQGGRFGNERVPLFVTGRLASLRLGPGGGNLEGARIGAERIAWALQEVLEDGAGDEVSKKGDRDREKDEARFRYATGIGSRFESLAEDD